MAKRSPRGRKESKRPADPSGSGRSPEPALEPLPFPGLPAETEGQQSAEERESDATIPPELPPADPPPGDAFPTPEPAPDALMSPGPTASRRPTLGELKAASCGEANPRGLVCGQCGCRNFEVDYTRSREGGILRKRLCRHCRAPLMTIEKPVLER
jgi:hypothetical protein